MKVDAGIIERLLTCKERLDTEGQQCIDDVVRVVDELGEQVRMLQFRLGQFFRRKTEKVDEKQLAMAFIAHLVADATSSDGSAGPDGLDANGEAPGPSEDRPAEATQDEENSGEGKGRRRSRRRKSQTQLLPVKVVDVFPADDERRCAEHGDSMVEIACKIYRQIIFEPAKAYILEERVHVEECEPCGYDNPVAGTPTPKLFEAGLASSSLLSHIIVAKVIDGIPLERVARQLERHGVHLATARLYDWYARVADEVDAVCRYAREELLRSSLVSLDDTPYTFKAGKNGPKRGRVWLYIGDNDRVAYCRFTENWQGVHPRSVLEGFSGIVQNDGYGGISPLFGWPGGPVRLGCHDHSRRKLVAAMDAGDDRAVPLVGLYRTLYLIERRARNLGLDPPDVLDLREREARPIWVELCRRVDELAKVVGKRTLLGRALTYLSKQRDALTLYLTDGTLPIANAHVEQLLRIVATSRKSSMYIGSSTAGERYANLLTLAMNCVLCGANPYEYFRDVIDRIAEGFKARNVALLMPQRWAAERGIVGQPAQ